MRLIDADAMHKFVEDKVAEGKDGWANGVPYEWAYALTAVDMQPTIDAAPVVHGYWIEVFGRKYGNSLGMQCSECGRRVRNRGENYCPKCGVKMDRTEVL